MTNPNTKRPRLPTVAYIAGNHRSGSTLLDMVMGSHSKTFSLGEIVALSEYYDHNKPCTCGEPIDRCPFWLQVQQNLSNEMALPAPCSRYKPIHTGADLLKGLIPMPSSFGLTTSVRYDNRLLDAISSVSGRDCIIDSSKAFSRLLFYLLAYGGRTVVIHLTRDPRSVINSLLRTTEYATERLDLWIDWWRDTQTRLRRLSGILNSSRIIHLRFEDFCRNPAESLAPTLAALRLEFDPGMLEYGRHDHHTISGNIKTRKKTVATITFREAWREELPVEVRAKVERRLARQMKSFGYD